MYIATLLNGSFSEDNMHSVITFDKGGTWELLQPPAQTQYGEHIDCQVTREGWDREKPPQKWRLGMCWVILEGFSMKREAGTAMPPQRDPSLPFQSRDGAG